MTVTLITGATRGIGRETARQLVARGHRVWLGARDLARGEALAATLGARAVRLDVTDDASVADAVATVGAAEGRLDVLVNNAGIIEGGVVDGPTAVRVLDTNVAGVVRVTEAALPLLRRSARPRVVTVSSSAGSFWAVTHPHRPEWHVRAPLYSASKAAATMLTVQYAKAHPDVTFAALEPGFTATELTAGLPGGRPVEQSARVVVDLVTRDELASGTLHDEHGTLAW